MAINAASSSSSPSSSLHFACSFPSSQFLSRPKLSSLPFPPPLLSIPRLTPRRTTPSLSLSLTAAAKGGGENAVPSKNPRENKKEVVEEEEVEVEEELPWIQEKALDIVEFTGSVTQAIPGPRVGTSSLPWILAVPLAYAGVTFVIAFVKTVKKFTSPSHKRKKLLPEFCSKDSSLIVKEIFGVTDEDVEKLRLHTFSEAGDMDSLQKMVDVSESEDSSQNSSNAA